MAGQDQGQAPRAPAAVQEREPPRVQGDRQERRRRDAQGEPRLEGAEVSGQAERPGRRAFISPRLILIDIGVDGLRGARLACRPTAGQHAATNDGEWTAMKLTRRSAMLSPLALTALVQVWWLRVNLQASYRK